MLPTDRPARAKTPVWVWLIAGGGGCFFPIVIMAAILFPVFAQAREKARQTVCASNIKKQTLSVLMYQQDYDNALPPAKAWMDKTEPYMPKEKEGKNLYQCPAAHNPSAGTNYAFNNIGSSKKATDEMTNLNRTPLIYDSTSTERNANDAFKSYPVPGRHSNGDNIGFMDGHVKWLKPGSSLEEYLSSSGAEETPPADASPTR